MMGGESVEMGQSGLSVFCRSRAGQNRTVCKAGNGLAWWRRIAPDLLVDNEADAGMVFDSTQRRKDAVV